MINIITHLNLHEAKLILKIHRAEVFAFSLPALWLSTHHAKTRRTIELETDDFLNFRLACKELNSKSFSQFLGRYFKVRYHVLDRYSLNNLVEVSGHPVFGPSLHTLEIGVDHLTENPPLYHPGTWDDPGPLPYYDENHEQAAVDTEAYKRYLADQKYMVESGLDTAYLTRALINLSNCKVVRINDTNRTWGAASQKRHTGVFPTTSMDFSESIDYLKRLVRVVLAAIMASQVSLDLLEISPGFNREAMGPQMLPARPDLCISQSLSQLTPLTSLSLMIDPGIRSDAESWTRKLLQFIELFPALPELSLGFYPHDEEGRLSALSTSLRLQYLQVLSIDWADCSEEDLARLFLNHKDTLREINLDCVFIKEGRGSWQSLRQTVQEQLSIEKFSQLNCE